MKLGELADIWVNKSNRPLLPEDIEVTRSGSVNFIETGAAVAKENSLLIRVKRTDIHLPRYLYYVLLNLSYQKTNRDFPGRLVTPVTVKSLKEIRLQKNEKNEGKKFKFLSASHYPRI